MLLLAVVPNLIIIPKLYSCYMAKQDFIFAWIYQYYVDI